MDEEIKICTDLGSSLGKGCYDLRGVLHWIALENAINQEKVRDFDGDSCVIEFKGKAWTIGAIAVYGLHETVLHKNKAEQASLRLLGLLGKVIENENFTEGYIDLTVLLPQGERRFFKSEEEMASALPELSTPEYTGYKNRFTDSYLLIKGGNHDS